MICATSWFGIKICVLILCVCVTSVQVCTNILRCIQCKGDHNQGTECGSNETECLHDLRLLHYSTHYNKQSSPKCLCHNVVDNIKYTDSPVGRWQAWTTCNTRCLVFELSEHPSSEVNYSSNETTLDSVGYCLKECFDNPDCHTCAYISGICHQYNCGSACEITSGSFTVYRKTCYEECPFTANTTAYSVKYEGGLTVGGKAEIICNHGYTFASGDLIRICQDTHTWNGTDSECHLVNCSTPPQFPHATPTLLPGTTYNSTVTYFCDPGYYMTGSMLKRCDASGEWVNDGMVEEPLQCLVLGCGFPPNVSFAQYELSLSTNDGSIANYSCQDGYETDGSLALECISNGSWIGAVPRCSIIICIDPPLVSNANYSLSSGLEFGSVASYTCGTGFIITDSTELVQCNAHKRWSGVPPSCTEINCPVLTDPLHGRVLYTTRNVKSTAEFNCDPGYIINGQTETHCSNGGQWNGNLPNCDPVVCPSLMSPPIGHVNHSFGTTFMDRAYYTCDFGYKMVGYVFRECLENGTWSGPTTECLLIDCGRPQEIPDGLYTLIDKDTLLNNSVAYSCDVGFVLSGQNVSTCTEEETWNAPAPTCSPLNCGSLKPPLNGYVHIPSGTTFGKTAVYYCKNGFLLTGSSTNFCNSDGIWEGIPPSCKFTGLTTAKPLRPLYIMPCLCHNRTFIGMTDNEIISSLVANMTVPRNSTSLYKSKLVCRKDDRLMSKLMGIVSVAIVCAILTSVFVSDFKIMKDHASNYEQVYKKRLKRRSHTKKK